MKFRVGAAIAAVLLSVVVVAGCGDDEDDPSPVDPSSSTVADNPETGGY